MSDQRLAALELALGYYFRDVALLREALHHSSYVNEQPDSSLKDNERLEFLGDAVLDLAITHLLMESFPESPEGDLSRMRAAIVNASQLAAVAQRLDLGQHLLLGRGEALSNGQEKSSILADTFEAVVAAVYLDGGLQAVFDLVRKHFSVLLAREGETPAAEDYKSRLQELVQSELKMMPQYRVIAESGPDHDKTFEVRLKVGSNLMVSGTGKSKKAAEQAAAGEALKWLENQGG